MYLNVNIMHTSLLQWGVTTKEKRLLLLQMVSKKHYCTWAAKTQRLKTVSKPFQCLPFFLTACCVWQVGLHAVLPFTNTHALLQYQCIQNCVLALCTFSSASSWHTVPLSVTTNAWFMVVSNHAVSRRPCMAWMYCRHGRVMFNRFPHPTFFLPVRMAMTALEDTNEMC